MRPKGMLANTIAMGVLNLSAFVIMNWSHRVVVAIQILVVLASYLVLWFFWKGRNWARLLVLVVSVGSILNLLALIHPYGNVVLYDSIVISWAVLAFFLLYWLNRTDVREWFKSQKKTATDQPQAPRAAD